MAYPLITNYEAKSRIIDEHTCREWGTGEGNIRSIVSRDDEGVCVESLVIARGSRGKWSIKVGRRFTRYYGETGVLAHEEETSPLVRSSLLTERGRTK